MKLITRDALKSYLSREQPNNIDRSNGFALVNVLPASSFRMEHIAGSINIPEGNEADFERLFDKGKKIIVYCASPECPASSTVEGKLAKRGFSNVTVYKGGISEWRLAGFPIVKGDLEPKSERVF